MRYLIRRQQPADVLKQESAFSVCLRLPTIGPRVLAKLGLRP